MPAENLIRIVPHSVELGEIPFNLYASDSNTGVILFCKAGFSITKDHLDKLKHSSRQFFIGSNEISSYHEYAVKRLSKLIEDDNTPVRKKLSMVRSLSEMSLSDLFRDPRSAKAMKSSGEFARSYLDLIINSDVAVESLFAISTSSAYLLSHSINVCTFCILIGEYLFGNNHEKLWKAGTGGLLLDVGMSIMDKNILEKEGKLDDKEVKLMRLHTLKSQEIMKSHDLPEEMQLMGRNHHERADGSGYPDKLKLNKTSEYARIAAVADVYDAMTSDRGYRKKKSHFAALAEMSLNKHLFDHRVLEILMKIVLQNDQLVTEFMIGGKNIQKLCEEG